MQEKFLQFQDSCFFFQNLFDFKEIYWTFYIIHLSLILPYKYIIENNHLCVTVSTDLSTKLYSNLLPFLKLRDFIYWTLIVGRTLFYSFLLLSYELIDILYWILVVCFLINKYGIKIFSSNVRGYNFRGHKFDYHKFQVNPYAIAFFFIKFKATICKEKY